MEKIEKERDIIDKSDKTKYRSIRLVEKVMKLQKLMGLSFIDPSLHDLFGI